MTDQEEKNYQEKLTQLQKDVELLKSLFICCLSNFTISQMDGYISNRDKKLFLKYTEDITDLASKLTDDLEFLEMFINKHSNELEYYNLDEILDYLSQYRKIINSVDTLTEHYILNEL